MQQASLSLFAQPISFARTKQASTSVARMFFPMTHLSVLTVIMVGVMSGIDNPQFCMDTRPVSIVNANKLANKQMNPNESTETYVSVLTQAH